MSRYTHILLPLTLRQTLKYLSQTPCSRQRPETVKEFLTTMMHHKLTKSVFFTKPSVLLCNVLFLASLLSCYFPSSGQKNFNCWTTGRRQQWKFSWWVWLITINTCYQDFLEILYISIVVSCLPWLKQFYFLKLFKYVIHEGIAMRARLICH